MRSSDWSSDVCSSDLLGAREDPSGIAAMCIHAIGGYRAAAGLRPKYPAITAASRGNASQGRSLFGKRIRARHSRLAEACSGSGLGTESGNVVRCGLIARRVAFGLFLDQDVEQERGNNRAYDR